MKRINILRFPIFIGTAEEVRTAAENSIADGQEVTLHSESAVISAGTHGTIAVYTTIKQAAQAISVAADIDEAVRGYSILDRAAITIYSALMCGAVGYCIFTIVGKVVGM